MSNRVEFQKFIAEDGVLYNGKNYADGTKDKRLKMVNEFIEKSGKDIYQINESEEIIKLLELEKFFIKNLSDNHMKRGLEWYLEFLLSREYSYISADEISDDEDYPEGSKKSINVNVYERNSQARKKCLEEYGYKCSVCEFDFEKIYGLIGKDFIHVHHVKPLSEINGEYKVNPIEDLRPVCPNCHAMLHKKKPIYTIEELKKILNSYLT